MGKVGERERVRGWGGWWLMRSSTSERGETKLQSLLSTLPRYSPFCSSSSGQRRAASWVLVSHLSAAHWARVVEEARGAANRREGRRVEGAGAFTVKNTWQHFNGKGARTSRPLPLLHPNLLIEGRVQRRMAPPAGQKGDRRFQFLLTSAFWDVY